jgi:hypothetical protein
MLSPRMVPDNTYLMRLAHSNLLPAINRVRLSHHSREKGIPDSILSTLADRYVGPHPVSLLLSTKEVVKKVKHLSTADLLGPYLLHAIDAFNTCSRGSIHRSLTNTGGGYNHLRAPPDLRLSNLNNMKHLGKCDIKHLSPTRGLSTTRRLPKSISTLSND